MLDKLMKFAGVIPLAAIIIYILGYISLISYLQSFGIIENIGLDFAVLKLGVLFFIVIGPIVLLSFAEFKIGDYSNAKKDVPDLLINTLHDALGYTIIYSIALGMIMVKLTFDIATGIMFGFLVIGIVLNKISIKSINLKLIKGIFMIIPFISFYLLCLVWPNNPRVYLYLLQLAVFFSCAHFRIFNKEGLVYQLSKICTVIIFMFYSATLFGAFVIGNIPTQYGGEKKSPIIYHIVTDAVEKIKKTALKSFVKNDNTIFVKEVYQGTVWYYFMTPFGKIVAIPKSFIESEEIIVPNGYPVNR